MSLGAVLTPWRCEGTLSAERHGRDLAGKPCNKLLAEVDVARPIYVKVRCGRCGHENVLVETYAPDSARMGAKTV